MFLQNKFVYTHTDMPLIISLSRSSSRNGDPGAALGSAYHVEGCLWTSLSCLCVSGRWWSDDKPVENDLKPVSLT